MIRKLEVMRITFSKDTQTVIERGQAAWQRLLSKEQETWSDWLVIGEAIEEATTAMMRGLGLNRPEGKRWADNFGDWLRETGFHKIDKAVRSRLKKCMEHRSEVEEWRASLPIEKRVHYNHPTTVWRNWNAAFGVSASIKKGPTKVEQLTAANLELQDNLDKALAEVTRLRPLAEAAEASEEDDAVLSWRYEPQKAASRMLGASFTNAVTLAQSILSRQQALHHALDGSLPELVKEITKSDPNGAKLLIDSLGVLMQELQAVIGGDKSQTDMEPAEPESKPKRQRRAATPSD
jgi:hypothetical protein